MLTVAKYSPGNAPPEQMEHVHNKLRESEARLRLALDAGRLGYWDADMVTNLSTWSPTMETMHGLAVGSFKENGLFGEPGQDYYAQFVHAEDRDRVKDTVGSLVREGRTEYHSTYRVIRPDGAVRWMEARGRFLRDEQGRPLRLLGVCADVTEQREAEEQTRRLVAEQAARAEAEAARQRIAAILHSISEPLLTLDRTLRLRFANHPAEQLLGHAQETLAGRDIRGEFPFALVPSLMQQCERALAECTPVEHEAQLPDGRWVELRASPFDQGLSVYLRDITARRREEEARARLARSEALRAEVSTALSRPGELQEALQRCTQAMVDHLGASFARIWLLNAQSATLELQASAGKYTRLDGPYSQVPVGQHMVGRIAQERRPHVTNDVRSSLAADPTRTQQEGLVAFAGYPLQVGEELLGVVGLFANQPFQPEGLVGLASTADALAHGIGRHRAEQALAHRASELTRSNQELEQFAYVASHDLQEPLRMVASFSQLLAERYKGKLDEKADRYINFAVDGVTRMQRLIQDLLTYSRVGTQGKELAPVDLGETLRRVLTNLEMTVKESQATVTVDAMPGVIGDDIQLEQLFQNLIGNALKFRSPTLPPRVHVSAVRERDRWRLSVSDNGIGMEPQYFQRIFIIFQRLHGKGTYAGTGIGLAICKKIVERHNGRIWVESRAGEGSTFLFTLPMDRSVRSDP